MFFLIIVIPLHHKLKVMKTESIHIKFDGQNHQIDANTLINTLIHYSTVINVANDTIGDGSRKVNIKINALEKGSFVINIELVASFVQNLFSAETIAYLSGLATIVGGVYALYDRHKGKPVKEETNINVENKIITINKTTIEIYNNKVVREAISKSIETVNDDPAVESVEIGNDRGEFVNFKREDFNDLIYDDFSTEDKEPEEKRLIVDATLGIIKLSFERGKSWEFMYNGFKISIVVKDDDLMKHIDSGARFAKGDSIKVKLEIVQKYNPNYMAYENKSYRIVEFKEHIKAPTQSKIDF